ncbi:MAG: sugar ABC transporter ATP-binding protein [Christensenellaceae bacterium]
MDDHILQFKNLTKKFPGVTALNDVSFDIKRNTVHCLLGENGAGKSTLIKILTGAQPRTSGIIYLNEKEFSASSTKEARESGISTLFQELNVVDQLTVEENLSLGMEKTKLGFFKKDEQVRKSIETLKSIEPSINIKTLVSKLSVAKKQIVEIAKAIATDAEIIIMDEPTAAISESEIDRLFKIINELKAKNVTVIYISHRLDEIFEIGDYVTVLRDGKHIETKSISEVKDRTELVKMILGKTVVEEYIPNKVDYNTKIIELKNITNKKLKNVSFDVFKGEVIGVYGLVGAGKTELSNTIYGIDQFEGKMLINNKEVKFKNATEAIESGIALAPEERRTEGIFSILSIRQNIPVMNMKKIASSGIISSKAELKVSQEHIEMLNIVTNTDEKEVSLLSGGNQQKVVFAKCLFSDSDILLLDEPTRGVDVGAKEEIHNIIRDLSKNGKTIMVFSSELPEVLNLCDRILLMYDGELKGEINNGKDIDGEKIIHIVTGGE